MTRPPDSGHNAQRSALWVIASALVFVLLYPQLHTRVEYLQEHCRTYRDPLRIFSTDVQASAAVAGMIPDVLQQTATPGDSVTAAPVTMHWPVTSHTRGRDCLGSFYEALARADTSDGTVRIAYYGDSQIEGDLITQTLRRRLQKRFGGTGVGFVPVTSVAARHRASIYHQYSGDWRRFSLDRKPHPPYAVGINGEYFAVKPGVDTVPDLWVNYRKGRFRGSRLSLGVTRLFYGAIRDTGFVFQAPAPCQVEISAADSSCTYMLDGLDPVNETVVWTGAIDELTARWPEPVQLPIYGFSFEGEPGVYLDNHSTRGSAGAALSFISPEILQGFQDKLHYDLVVLQFGLNLVQDNPGDFAWYERALKVTIRRFQRLLPGTAILVVSIADKSRKNEYGELITDPCIPEILEIQRRVAESCDVAFFDLFAAMGGPGTLQRWVQEDPPLANRDYTHVNWRGSLVLAKLIDVFLMDGLKEYRRETS